MTFVCLHDVQQRRPKLTLAQRNSLTSLLESPTGLNSSTWFSKNQPVASSLLLHCPLVILLLCLVLL